MPERKPASKAKSRRQRHDIDVARVATGQQVTGLRDLADRRASGENVHKCGIEAQIGCPFIAKAGGEPISICVGKASRPKLIADGGRIEREATAEGPVWVGAVARSDAGEPCPVPLLGLIRQSGAVGSFNSQIFDDAPIGPLNFRQ